MSVRQTSLSNVTVDVTSKRGASRLEELYMLGQTTVGLDIGHNYVDYVDGAKKAQPRLDLSVSYPLSTETDTTVFRCSVSNELISNDERLRLCKDMVNTIASVSKKYSITIDTADNIFGDIDGPSVSNISYRTGHPLCAQTNARPTFVQWLDSEWAQLPEDDRTVELFTALHTHIPPEFFDNTHVNTYHQEYLLNWIAEKMEAVSEDDIDRLDIDGRARILKEAAQAAWTAAKKVYRRLRKWNRSRKVDQMRRKTRGKQ